MRFLIGGFIGGLRTVLGIAALAMLIKPISLNDQGTLLLNLMIGAIVAGFIVTRFSGFRGAISQPQDGPAVLLSVFAGSLLLDNVAPDLLVAIVVASVAISSIFTGIIFFLIGQMRLGRLVRFIPFPVIGGFLAGSGLLMILAALSILINQKPMLIDLKILTSSGYINILFFGILLTIILIKIPPMIKSKLAFPAILIVGTLFVHLYFYLQQVSISEMQDMGWLIAPKERGSSTSGFFWFDIPLSAWNVLANNFFTFVAIAIVSIVMMLLNLSGLELSNQSELDFDKELKITGVANIFGGLLGGLVNFVSLSASLLGQQLKIESRFLGYAAYIFILFFLLVGPEILGFVPKPVLGALLLCVGISLVDQWLIKAYRRFTRLDYIAIVSIALITTFSGYLTGVTAGVVLCAILFAWSYSQVKVVTLEASGLEFRSNVDRPLQEKILLEKYGSEIVFLRVEGYLFFGSVHSIYEQIKDFSGKGVNYFILDLSLVKATDSSAIIVFQKISQFCQKKSLVLQFARPRQEFINLLNSYNVDGFAIEYTMDRDKSLEKCENFLIEKYNSEIREYSDGAWQAFSMQFKTTQSLEQFKSFFSLKIYKEKEYLIKQGDIGNEMYLVESGRFEAFIEPSGKDSHEIRLKTMTVGAMFGEIVLYSSMRRTASVRAETSGGVYVLTKERLSEMESKFPELASALHRSIIGVMAERLLASNKMIRRMDP
jgi:SulP family sulfate permease